MNHGDFWANNIMFQYDAFGKIKETYLVDYQIPKYGSPAQDLYYFLLSSAKFELKLKEFDFFIKIYYDNLVEHLRLLKYPKNIPKLNDIHAMLYKYGLWGKLNDKSFRPHCNIVNFSKDMELQLVLCLLSYLILVKMPTMRT